MPARVRAGRARLAVVAGLSALVALADVQAAHARPPDVAARTPIATPGASAAATGSISAARLKGALGGLARAAGAGSGVWVYDADSERTLF